MKVNPLAVPSSQSMHCEGVPKIIGSRSDAAPRRLQSSFLEEFV
jgi:hypothetical protein